MYLAVYPYNVSHAHIKIPLIRAWRTDKANRVISRIGNRARPTASNFAYIFPQISVFLPSVIALATSVKLSSPTALAHRRIRMSRRYIEITFVPNVFLGIPFANTESANFRGWLPEIWQLDSPQKPQRSRRILLRSRVGKEKEGKL